MIDPAAIAWSPPLGLTALRDEVHIYCASLDVAPAYVQVLFRLLSTDEQKRSERFHFQADRTHFIVARGFLRIILGGYLGQEPTQIRFTYGSHGKPALSYPLGPAALNFNISHSHGMGLFAVTQGRELGVDLEFMRVDVPYVQIARQFFSPQEVAVFRSIPVHKQKEVFFRCWTRKEAYIKGEGLGLSYPLDRFTVSLTDDEPAALLGTSDGAQDIAHWALHPLDAGAEYAAALAVERGAAQIRCWGFDHGFTARPVGGFIPVV